LAHRKTGKESLKNFALLFLTLCQFVWYTIPQEVSVLNTVFYGVVVEEKGRNLERQEAYLKEIELLPKGYIVAKNRGTKKYYYLQYRSGSKVMSEYIGNDETDVENIRRGIAKRKHFQGLVKKLRHEYKQMCKVVKG